MRIRRALLTLLGTVALIAGAAACQPEHELPAEDVARIDAAVGEVLSRGVAGVSVAVDAPGRERFTRAWGHADAATREPLTPEHHLRVASVTKSFTAVAVLRLAERGRLGLDDPLARYVEGVPNGDRITIRHLLAMRSGLSDFSQDPGVLDQLVNQPGMPDWRPEQVVDVVRRYPPAAEPDTVTAYSNTNYVLAGLIIERVTGRPVEEVLERLVIRPARLRSTLLPTTPAVPAPAPRTYLVDPATGRPTDVTDLWTPRLFWTAGGMVATIGDLTTWSRRLAGGDLLGRRAERDRRRFTALGGGPEYGLGVLRLGGWEGHNGIFLGDSTFAATLPATGTTIAVYANTRDAAGAPPADELFVRIAEILHPGTTAAAGAAGAGQPAGASAA